MRKHIIIISLLFFGCTLKAKKEKINNIQNQHEEKILDCQSLGTELWQSQEFSLIKKNSQFIEIEKINKNDTVFIRGLLKKNKFGLTENDYYIIIEPQNNDFQFNKYKNHYYKIITYQSTKFVVLNIYIRLKNNRFSLDGPNKKITLLFRQILHLEEESDKNNKELVSILQKTPSLLPSDD
jgi:hypothetical protein